MWVMAHVPFSMLWGILKDLGIGVSTVLTPLLHAVKWDTNSWAFLTWVPKSQNFLLLVNGPTGVFLAQMVQLRIEQDLCASCQR